MAEKFQGEGGCDLLKMQNLCSCQLDKLKIHSCTISSSTNIYFGISTIYAPANFFDSEENAFFSLVVNIFQLIQVLAMSFRSEINPGCQGNNTTLLPSLWQRIQDLFPYQTNPLRPQKTLDLHIRQRSFFKFALLIELFLNLVSNF